MTASTAVPPGGVDQCGSCGQPIIWGVTAAGIAIPLDATDTGELVMVDDSPLLLEQRLFGPAKPLVRHQKRGHGPRSHFATCPDSASWRRRK